MSPMLMFAMRIPLVLAGLSIIAIGLLAISANPKIQMVLAQAAID